MCFCLIFLFGRCNLQYCRFIKDISGLTDAESVNLSYCYAITDVSVLANVKKTFELIKCADLSQEIEMLFELRRNK